MRTLLFPHHSLHDGEGWFKDVCRSLFLYLLLDRGVGGSTWLSGMLVGQGTTCERVPLLLDGGEAGHLGVPDGTMPGCDTLSYMPRGVGVVLVIHEFGLPSLGAVIEDLELWILNCVLVIWVDLKVCHLVLAHFIWNRNRR